MLNPVAGSPFRIWRGKTEPSTSVRGDWKPWWAASAVAVLDDYVSRLKRAGFAPVQLEKHAEAARKMVEVSGACRRPVSSTC